MEVHISQQLKFVERIEPNQPEWDAFIANHVHRYRFAAGFVQGMRVLDAGCGAGFGSRMLAQAGASEVVAVDVSEEALLTAQKHFAHSRVRFVRDNCESLSEVKGPFDVIVALESLEHFRGVQRFLEQVVRLISRDGLFICSTPNALVTKSDPKGHPLNPYHIQEYGPDEYRDVLQKYFADVFLTGQHFTAAYVMATQLYPLWSNPLMRVGRFLQQLRGRKQTVPCTARATEGDHVISEAHLGNALVLLALCRNPRSGRQPSVA